MPDKDVMLQVKQLEEQLGWRAAEQIESDPDETDPAVTRFAAALSVLSGDWRDLATLYDKAKLKGAKTAYIDPLRHAAQQLDKVIAQLGQPRRAPLGQIQPASAPPAAADALDVINGTNYPPAECPNVASKHAHPGHNWIGGPQGNQDPLGARGWRWCSGHVGGPTERPGLDALIRDSIQGGAAIPAQRTPEPETSLAAALDDPAALATYEALATGDDVTAYLSGALAELPGPPPPPSTVRNTDPTTGEAIEPPADLLGEVEPAPITTARENLSNMSPEIAAAIPPVPLLGQPGDAGAGYGVDYIPPNGVPATFAELLQPVPAAALPPHLSHSQIGTVGECGAKYRLTRVGRNLGQPEVIDTTLPEVPEWAHIGGSAFHAIVEDMERAATLHGAEVLADAQPETLWAAAFDAEIGKIEASSPVPRSRWRAANKGTEHEGWWRVNGPQMIARYLAARPAEPTVLLPDPAAGAALAIEIERTVQVPTGYGPIPYKAIIDRVTLRHDPATGVTTYVIRDYKTGKSVPDSPQQLGEYANVLRLLGVPPTARIVGTYFNARKGEWTREVDLDSAYPAEWFQYYITAGYAQRLALTTGPTPARPSSFCGGCSVRWACPVKGVNAPGGAGGAR